MLQTGFFEGDKTKIFRFLILTHLWLDLLNLFSHPFFQYSQGLVPLGQRSEHVPAESIPLTFKRFLFLFLKHQPADLAIMSLNHPKSRLNGLVSSDQDPIFCSCTVSCAVTRVTAFMNNGLTCSRCRCGL